MTHIALIGQTLRMNDCTAFVRQTPGSWTIVVGDRHGITQDDLPPGGELVRLSSAPVPTGSRLKADLRRSVLRLMRRGSSLGRHAENGLRRVKRLVAPADPGYDPMGRMAGTANEALLTTHTEEILSFLECRHQQAPIAEVVVFDLFDLPAALAFAQPKGLPVSVR